MMLENKKIEEQLKVILKNQQTMQGSIDRLDRDLSEDRKDIGDLKITNGNIINQMDEIRELFSKQTTRIGDKISEVTQPFLDEAQDLRDVITEKKIVAIDVKKVREQKKHWFQFWK